MTKILLSTASAAALALSASTAMAQENDPKQPIEQNPPVTESADDMATEQTAEDLNETRLDATADTTLQAEADTDLELETETTAEADAVTDAEAEVAAVAEVQEQETDEAVADPVELAEVEEETAEALTVLSNLTEGHMSAREFLGAPVIGVDGERIARVDDLVIGNDNQIDQAILISGGFFGLGGTKAAVDFDELDINFDMNRDPQVAVSMTEETIKNVAEFEQTQANDWRLASELIGASGSLGTSDRDITITDIIVSANGEAEYLIAADGLMASFGGDRRAIDYDRLTISQGDGGVMIDLDANTYDNMTLFTYRPDAAGDATMREKNWSKDEKDWDKKEKKSKTMDEDKTDQ